MSEQAAPVFSQDWFSRSIPAWTAVLGGLAKRNPSLRVLEVEILSDDEEADLRRLFPGLTYGGGL